MYRGFLLWFAFRKFVCFAEPRQMLPRCSAQNLDRLNLLYVEVHGARLRQYMPRAMRAIRACYVGPCASPLFFIPFFPPGRLQSLVDAVRSQGPPLNPQPPKQCFVPSCFLSGDLVDHLSSPWIRSNAFFVVARSTYIYRNLLLKHM